MTRTWMKGLLAIVLASPAALVAVYEKKSPARDHAIDARVGVQLIAGDRLNVVPRGAFPNDTINPDDHEAFVRGTTRTVSIEAEKKIVFTPGTVRRTRSLNGPGFATWGSVHSVGGTRAAR